METFTRQLTDFLGVRPSGAGDRHRGRPPTSHVLGAMPLDRADEPRPSLPRDAILSSAPDPSISAGLFRVPRVIG